MGEQVIGAAIELAGTDNIVAHFADGLQRIKNSRHAGGHRQRTHTAFQLRHALFQNRIGGVHDAGVDVALHLQVEQIGTVLGVIEGVGRGLVDRGGSGPGSGIAFEACVQR